MAWKELLVYFLTGGTVTTLIVALEESGRRHWSGFAALVPIFTLVSYVFIGNGKGGGSAVSKHSMFVLAGTLVSWVPYMLVVALLSPHMPPNKAIGIGLAVFLVLAAAYLAVVAHFRLFT